MSDTARVESPFTQQNAQDAFNLVMELQVLGRLLKGLDDDSAPIEIHQWNDLGSLICRLTEQPASLLGELATE